MEVMCGDNVILEQEVVGPLEQEVLDEALKGTQDDLINAIAIVARAIDDLSELKVESIRSCRLGYSNDLHR